ncbi:hypothetical protein ACWGLP_13590 [Streptomyces lydicus]
MLVARSDPPVRMRCHARDQGLVSSSQELKTSRATLPGQMVFPFTDLPGQLLWWGYLNLLTLH